MIEETSTSSEVVVTTTDNITDNAAEIVAMTITKSDDKTIGSANLRFENSTVRMAFETFVKNYKEPVCQFLNTFLKTEGVSSDAFIDVTDDTITVYQLAPDKGEVLLESPSGVTLGKYTSVETGSKYAVLEGGALWLFLKEGEGEPDIKVGQFKSLSDASKDWNSTSVEDTIKQVREYQTKLKENGRKKGDKKVD